MSELIGPIIEKARAQGAYTCAHCDYDLKSVPLRDDLSIVCPECGYEMVFSVQVRLRPRNPEYDREIRSRLSRLERILIALGVVVLAGVLVILLTLLLVRGL